MIKLVTRIRRIWRQLLRQRQLRNLQHEYYQNPAHASEVTAEYLRVLADARDAETVRKQKVVALHAGSGGHYIKDWINVDIDPAPPVDLAADLSAAVPIRSGSVDYIHSEDFLEHLDLEGGKRFIAEAFRVLRPGGTMRLLTPDLRAIIDRVYYGGDASHLAWCHKALNAAGPCEALNMHLRMNGAHRFLYDHDYLCRLLLDAGFIVRQVSYNRSPNSLLRYLDLRDFGLNLFLEAHKPN
jgi:predicted SAM-dependent methyltransferase